MHTNIGIPQKNNNKTNKMDAYDLKSIGNGTVIVRDHIHPPITSLRSKLNGYIHP